MATNAEHQRAYRQRHLVEGSDARLNTVVSPHAKAALARLARHYAVSQRAMLERLVGEAESALIDSMNDQMRRSYLR